MLATQDIADEGHKSHGSAYEDNREDSHGSGHRCRGKLLRCGRWEANVSASPIYEILQPMPSGDDCKLCTHSFSGRPA